MATGNKPFGAAFEGIGPVQLEAIARAIDTLAMQAEEASDRAKQAGAVIGKCPVIEGQYRYWRNFSSSARHIATMVRMLVPRAILREAKNE